MSANHSENSRIDNSAQLEGNFLEGVLPLQAFVTLTTPQRRGRNYMDDAFARWVMTVQAGERQTLGWIVSEERYPGRHLHVGLVAARPIDCAAAEQAWLTTIASSRAEMALVKHYQDGLCGLGYILKSLATTTEDARFSHNLSAFAEHKSSRFYGRSKTEKRQIARIAEQIATRKSKRVGHPTLDVARRHPL